MENKLNKILYITMVIFLAMSLSMVMACSNTPEQKNKTYDKKAGQAMANPAAAKCIRDGYVLEPIMENGVPQGYMCVNPKTGKKCEEWNYFHKKCRLD